MKSVRSIFAPKALLQDGWAADVRVEIGVDGTIDAVERDTKPRADDLSLSGKALLPAPTNLHSHAFQRAMAGLTEYRSSHSDDFWTWRALMYRFVDQLTPDDVEVIAAQVQMEMLEAGYAACVEFHYLHHQPDGRAYQNPAEMSARIAAAAEKTGIGLTLLPVYYRHGGFNNRPAGPEQARFITDRDGFEAIVSGINPALNELAGGGEIGVAPHSLRAVSPEELDWVANLIPGHPVHIHIAEQIGEVDEAQGALGDRPVRWLLDQAPVDPRWCLVHATHMAPDETSALARSGAVAGLCPITECNLGDGIFDGERFLHSGGAFGVGSDSNVRISLSEELRVLEYSQRLRDRARAVLSDRTRTVGRTVGRTLFDAVCAGGGQAAGRHGSAISPGKPADLMTLDTENSHLIGLNGDYLLDGFVFAGDDRLVQDTFVKGRHLVSHGMHCQRTVIDAEFARLMGKIRSVL